jgi:hypothetical protein
MRMICRTATTPSSPVVARPPTLPLEPLPIGDAAGGRGGGSAGPRAATALDAPAGADGSVAGLAVEDAGGGGGGGEDGAAAPGGAGAGVRSSLSPSSSSVS